VGVEGVLRERSEASDERCAVNGYADFPFNRVPGFIVNATRIFERNMISHRQDFLSVKMAYYKTKNPYLTQSRTIYFCLEKQQPRFPHFLGAVTNTVLTVTAHPPVFEAEWLERNEP
jgi:hypothetical protein